MHELDINVVLIHIFKVFVLAALLVVRQTPTRIRWLVYKLSKTL